MKSESEEGSLYDIAVIGMAGRFPGAADVDQFWENLRDGIESITRFSPEELAAEGVDPALREHPDYVPAKGIVDGAEQFDAPFFNLSPREAEITDPQQRLFLECAWEALEDAACDPARMDGAVGVFAGSSMSSYLLSRLLFNPAVATVSALELRVANDRDFLATAVSYRLNLRGPSVNVATACSTSLVAVHLACQSLLNRECDVALAGGVSVSFPQRIGYLFQKGGIMSADGHCRAFDAQGTGTVGGEGAGVVVLKRLDDALADGDAIRAVIKGSAINNDGFLKAGFTAPSVQGQAQVIAEAQSVAGVEAGSVTYIEAHGSGTALGDSVEMRALNRAFEGAAGRAFCAVGSLKTNIGHPDAAAGVGGLIKTILALEHRLLPPSLHFEAPGPDLEIGDGPFYVNATLRPWNSPNGPRRAGVSSFGIGGTNAHVILEEAPEPASPPAASTDSLLVLSASTPTALAAMRTRLAAHLSGQPEQDLADVAFTLQMGRKAFSHRLAVACRDREDAIAVLAGSDPRRIVEGVAGTERRVAFLLPGVGDHYPGMGAGLYKAEPIFRKAVDRCADLLRPMLGEDLRDALLAVPPESEAGETDLRRMVGRAQESAASPLDRASILQPAVFAIEYALAKLWESLGVRPQAFFGYSLGEYTAACLAGVFSLEDALRVVVERARLLESLPAGAMLAVPWSEDELTAELGAELSLAAVNAPGVSVVSGSPDAVADLEGRLRVRGVASRRLPVAQALHSALMEPILEPFARLMGEVALRPPKLPYVTGVTGTWATPAEATSPGHWVRHLRQTVRFAAGIETLWQDPELILLEAGPGHGLTTLALQQERRTATSLALPSLRPAYERQDDSLFFLTALGRLWTAGVEVSWPRLHGGAPRRKVRLPTYPFERQPYIVGRVGQAPPQELGGGAPLPAAGGAMGEGTGVRHPRPALPTPYSAPQTATEETIAAIWRTALRLETVGVHDSFFHLGGHSLLASQIALRLEEALGVELPLGLLLERPTVAEIAAAADRLRAGEAPETSAVDLRREVVLDPAILPSAERAMAWANDPEAVLLTGATGFLGAFLLRDLLRETRASVYCLARGASTAEALARVRGNLEGYGLWEDGLAARIVGVPGDLGKPRWGMSDADFRGLAERTGAVYHCGAWVNFTYPYSALAPVNVQGTQEAIRFAALGPAKPIHFVSTIAVFAPGSFAADGLGMEDAALDSTDGLFGGYGQSKWVAEKILGLARKRGLDVTLYRPGAIGGDSTNGAGNPKDLIWSYLKGCIQLGAYPAIDAVFDPAPVDFVSRALVTLSRRPASRGRAFHLFNPNPVSWSAVFSYARSLGYPLRELPLADWIAELLAAVRGSGAQDNALSPFWPLFAAGGGEMPAGGGDTDPLQGRSRFDGRNTREGLTGTPVVCPPVESLLPAWFAHLRSSGFLPAVPEERQR